MKDVLSLCDGISGLQLALSKANIKYHNYYASEIDKFPIKVTQHHYPDTIQLGDMLNWRDWNINWSNIDLVCAGFPCFSKGTLVTTSQGLKPIEEISSSDMVLTHQNRFKPVVVSMQKVADHINYLKIQSVLPLEVTDEHPFYVRKMTRKGKKNIRTFSPPEWVKCRDLEKNDFIGIAINQNTDIPVFDSIPTESKYFWYLIGRYVANGYSSTTNLQSRGNGKGVRRSYKTVVTCGHHERQEIVDIIDSVSYHATISKETTSYKFTISDKNLWTFIQSFGRGADNKYIPSFMFDMPKYLLESFLEGYLSGDGCLHRRKEGKGNKNQYRITSISYKLIVGVQQLIQKVYKCPGSIIKHNVPSTKVIEDRTVNRKPFYTLSYYKTKPKQAHYYIDENGNYLWVSFKSRERMIKNVEVYNFEVQEDNSYCVSNLIVHNCQSWSLAGKQLGDRDSRGKLFWVVLDIMSNVLKYNPNVRFLLENVKMKKEFEEYITKHTEQALGHVNKILINSALVSAQNRKRFYWTNVSNISQPQDRKIYLKDIIESGLVDRDKSHCLDANYFKGGNLKSYFEKHRRQLVFSKDELCHVGDADLKGNDSIKRVYHPEGKSPTLTTMGGGHREPKVLCVAWRGRYVVDGKRQDSKTNTLTTVQKDNNVVDVENLKWRKLTPLECERLQTFPDGYTDILSNTQRYKTLGNAFTVDVIVHILNQIEL